MARHNIRLRLNSKKYKRFSAPRFRLRQRTSLLDTSISVRSIVKYTAIIVLFLVVLGFVFALGRHYEGALTGKASGEETETEETPEITGELKQTTKEETKETPEEETAEKQETRPAEYTKATPEEEKEQSQPAVTETVTQHTPEERIGSLPCVAKSVGFDYPYSRINLTIGDPKWEKKSDNWAVMTSVEVSITNGEECSIVNPTQLKLKLNNKGKGSSWWDDEVFLPDTFQKMMPGETVTETVPVHVSYSDIYMEKDFKAVAFDDYGIDMATYKNYIMLR